MIKVLILQLRLYIG